MLLGAMQRNSIVWHQGGGCTNKVGRAAGWRGQCQARHLQHADLAHRCPGGGYTKHNVARCWAAETAVLVDQPIAEELPHNAYYEYYAPGYRCATPDQDAVLLAMECKCLVCAVHLCCAPAELLREHAACSSR